MAGLAWLTYRHQPSWPVSSLVASSLAQNPASATTDSQIQPVQPLAQDPIDRSDPDCYCINVVRN